MHQTRGYAVEPGTGRLGRKESAVTETEGLWEKENKGSPVRFEVFTVVTMKNGVFWDVTPCGSCNNRRFGGT
jgi:hypothetical protein